MQQRGEQSRQGTVVERATAIKCTRAAFNEPERTGHRASRAMLLARRDASPVVLHAVLSVCSGAERAIQGGCKRDSSCAR